MPYTENNTNEFIDFINFFKVREKFGIIYQNIVFIGILCLFLLYINYNYLLIPIKDLSIVGVSADVLITLLFFKFYKTKFGLVWAFIHNISVGLIVAYVFFWSNDSLSDNPITKEILPIENVDFQDNHQRRNRGLQPIVSVNIKGKLHEITFPKSETNTTFYSRQVSITLKEGFWGYWVLTDIELMTANLREN